MTVAKARLRYTWLELGVVVAITAIAAFLRFYKIEQVPPGLNSDEAVGAVGALETLRSGLRMYYAGQGGGGSLGFYIAALGFAIFGPSVATLRGTAAFAGVVSVVATYFATREMFRYPAGDDGQAMGATRPRLLATLAALGLATSLWHTQSSRVAFAAIGVPFLQAPAHYFLWRGLNTGRRVHFVVSGVLLASLMYIYLSGSFAPLVYLAFFLLQGTIAGLLARHQPSGIRDQGSGIRHQASPALVHEPGQADSGQRSLLRQHFWNLAICAGVALVLVLPLLYFYLTAPELATGRAQQALFTNPLINQGDMWGTLRRSITGNLAAFGFSTRWFQGQPPANLILPVPVTLLFLLGTAISLWRIRRPAYLFVLTYWGMMLLPSVLSPDSIPHPLRAVGAAPAAYTLAAIGALGIAELGWWIVNRRLPTVATSGHLADRGQLSTGHWLSAVVLVVLGLIVARPVYRGFHYYMVEWPQTNDALAAFHVYAVELAAEMAKETNPQATFLLPRDTAAGDVNPNYTVMFLYTGQAGYAWVVDDENTIEETLEAAVQGRDVVHVVRWKTSKHTGADPKELIRYYLEKHGTFLDKRTFEYYDIETYRLEAVGPDLSEAPLTPAAVDFGGQLTLIGYGFGDASGSGEDDLPTVPGGDLLWARLRWRLTAPSGEDLKASVSVADSAGHVVGQIDKLLLNNILHRGSTEWAPGTEVDAYFLVPIAAATAPGDYRLGVTVYGADSLSRLPASAGDPTQVVTLGSVAVRPDLSPPAVDELGLDVVLNRPVSDGLTLLGLTTGAGEVLRPGEGASLAFLWRADQPLPDDYRVSLWAAQGGDAWPLNVSLPLAGIDYPSSRWAAGQVVRGWFDGRVPPDLESGDYTLGMRVTDSHEAVVAEVPLGTVRVQGWPRQFEAPPMQVRVGAKFGDQLELLGYDASVSGEGPGMLQVVLYWRALSEMEVGYTSFVHLLNAGGQVVSQEDHVPGDGAFPTSGWLPGEVIADEFGVPLPGSDAPAPTQVEVGVYDAATGVRLPVVDQTGQVIDTRILVPLVSNGE